MNIPKNLMYSKTHEWVDFTSETTAKVGLTDFAQDLLGSLVFVNLPDEGTAVTAGEILGDVESVKAVSDVNSPIDGIVSAINNELLNAPEMINEAPYDAWLVQISDITARGDLLDADGYEAFCKENK